MKGSNVLTPHETWNVLDSSKLKEYQECPRKFFYRYICGWIPDNPNIHLLFGEAWHLAMRELLLKGYSLESVADAYNAFLLKYREEYSEQWDVSNHPKNPGMALTALVAYCDRYKDEKLDVLYTEVAGTVPISADQVLHFRLDSVIQDKDGKKGSLEHKTTSRLSKSWTDQWQMSLQVGTYMHALCCRFGPENVSGITINGTVFKKDIEFIRVHVKNNIDMLEVWLWEVNELVKQIKEDTQRMLDCDIDSNVMTAFPRKPCSCNNWAGCQYYEFCICWPNPLRRVSIPSFGYKIKYWDPREERDNADTVMDLGNKEAQHE